MKFDSTQKSRTLKKVLVDIGFKPSTSKKIADWQLTEQDHQELMIIKVDSDQSEPKKNWQWGNHSVLLVFTT